MILLFEPTPRLCPNQPTPKYPPMGNFLIKDIINWFNEQLSNKRAMKQELVINKDSALLAKTMLDLCQL